jgi:uncharacterized protein YecA (UPF0149 family)
VEYHVDENTELKQNFIKPHNKSYSALEEFNLVLHLIFSDPRRGVSSFIK